MTDFYKVGPFVWKPCIKPRVNHLAIHLIDFQQTNYAIIPRILNDYIADFNKTAIKPFYDKEVCTEIGHEGF